MPPKPDVGLLLIFRMLLPYSLFLFPDNEKAMINVIYHIDECLSPMLLLTGS